MIAHIARVSAAAALVVATALSPAIPADRSQVDAATRQVERGARKLGEGKIGAGVEETAKGVGHTVVEGARFTGNTLKAAGKAAEPQAKTAWQRTREAAAAFGASVMAFLADLGK